MADVTVRKKGNGRYEVRRREIGGRRRGRTFDRAGDADKFATKVRRTQQTAGLVELDVDNPITIGEYVEVWWRRHAMPHLAENTRRVNARVGRPTPASCSVASREARAYVHLRGPAADAARARPAGRRRDDPQAHDDAAERHGPRRAPRDPADGHRQRRRRRAPTISATPARPGRLADDRRGGPQRQLADRHEAHPHSDHDTAGRGARQPPGLRRPASRRGAGAGLGSTSPRGHIRVERGVALGEIREDDVVKRHDRSVRLLTPLAEDLRAWKPARGAIPLPNQLVFSRRDGGVWQDHDWRNWRTRVFQPAAKAAGLMHARPYDLRGSFASLLIQEGKNVVDVAKQLGHTPETCVRY
jgi:hypothetical protein